MLLSFLEHKMFNTCQRIASIYWWRVYSLQNTFSTSSSPSHIKPLRKSDWWFLVQTFRGRGNPGLKGEQCSDKWHYTASIRNNQAQVLILRAEDGSRCEGFLLHRSEFYFYQLLAWRAGTSYWTALCVVSKTRIILMYFLSYRSK